MKNFLKKLVLFMVFYYLISLTQFNSFNPFRWENDKHHPVWVQFFIIPIVINLLMFLLFTNKKKRDKYEDLWK